MAPFKNMWYTSFSGNYPISWLKPPLNQVSFINYVTPIPEGLDGASATPILCAVGVQTAAIMYYIHIAVGIDRLQSP